MIETIPFWIPLLVSLVSIIVGILWFFVPIVGQLSAIPFWTTLLVINAGLWFIYFLANVIINSINTITENPITLFIIISLLAVIGFVALIGKKKGWF